MSIYRAKEGAEIGSFKRIKDRDTRRPPGNVSYVVDNLWAWTRPEAYPDRRNSKFASPNPEQALRSAGLLEDCLTWAGMEESQLETEGLPDQCLKHVFRVELVGDPVVAQLPEIEDARWHPDCKRLRKLLIEKLDGEEGTFSWPSKPMDEKHPASRLFQPCLTAAEVDEIFDTADELTPHKDEIRRAVTYWEDVELNPDSLAEKGEILFEFADPSDGDGFWRRPVQENS